MSGTLISARSSLSATASRTPVSYWMRGSRSTSAAATGRRSRPASPARPVPGASTRVHSKRLSRETVTATISPPSPSRYSADERAPSSAQRLSVTRCPTASGSSVSDSTRPRSASARMRSACRRASW